MPIATMAVSSSSNFSNQAKSSNALSDTLSLFSVEGLVAVVTGGGTGTYARPEGSNAYFWLCATIEGHPRSPTISHTGIGLMIAKALEHNGAIVYIVSRRLDVLEAAANEHNVRRFSFHSRPPTIWSNELTWY